MIDASIAPILNNLPDDLPFWEYVVFRSVLETLQIDKFVGVQPYTKFEGSETEDGIKFNKVYYMRYSSMTSSEDTLLISKDGVNIFSNGNRMCLEILSGGVTLDNKVSLNLDELTRDQLLFGNITVRNEVLQDIVSEFADNLTNKVIEAITEIATVERVDKSFVESMNIVCSINRACSEIAQKTRRGAGNRIIVSPVMLSYIQAAVAGSQGVWKPIKNEGVSKPFGTKLVGILNGTIEVYTSVHAPENEILVLYNGSSAVDSGITISLDLQPNIINGELTAEYGIHIDDVAKNYYTRMIFD